MKYIRLTKEQLENLHQEFILFLASQQITADEWKQLKIEKPHIAEEEIDIFSDYIWDKTLEKVKFLEKFEEKYLYFFAFELQEIKLIVIKSISDSLQFTSSEIIKKVISNLKSTKVEIFTASKTYSEDKKQDIFQLILQGGEISNGEIYLSLKEFIR